MFYLHPSENPTLILVTPLLNNLNYHSWSKNMARVLRSKRKWCLIDGSITISEFRDTEYSDWETCNSMVVSWLIDSIELSIS